jgi:hypothetical protein
MPPNWAQSTAPVTVSAGNWQAKIPIVGSGKFFRLKSAGANLFGRSLAQWQEVYWRWNLGSPQPFPTTDANGNVAIGNVVLMALPSVPGEGTPAGLLTELDEKPTDMDAERSEPKLGNPVREEASNSNPPMCCSTPTRMPAISRRASIGRSNSRKPLQIAGGWA